MYISKKKKTNRGGGGAVNSSGLGSHLNFRAEKDGGCLKTQKPDCCRPQNPKYDFIKALYEVTCGGLMLLI